MPDFSQKNGIFYSFMVSNNKIVSGLVNEMVMNTVYRIRSPRHVKAEFVSKNARIILGIHH